MGKILMKKKEKTAHRAVFFDLHSTGKLNS